MSEQRLWMFQLNPARASFAEGMPTTAANLYARMAKEERSGWYVRKNYLRAKPGDPVLVKVAPWRNQEPAGVVAFARISRVVGDVVHLTFDRGATDVLMHSPISPAELARRLPVDRSNLVDISGHAPWFGRQLRKRLLPAVEVPYEPDRLRIEIPALVAGDETAAQATARKTEASFPAMLHRLVGHLKSEGWSGFSECLSGHDVRAVKDGTVAVCCVQVGRPTASSIHFATTLLLLGRRDLGLSTRMMLATDVPLSPELSGFLEAAGVHPLVLPRVPASAEKIPPASRRGLGKSRGPLSGCPRPLPGGVVLRGPLQGAEPSPDRVTVGSGVGYVNVAIDVAPRQGRVRWELPAGQIIESRDPGVQHGILAQRVTLSPGGAEGGSWLLRLYCANKARHPSKAGTPFVLGPVTVDPDLLGFFEMLKRKRLEGSEDLVQKAIWEITDGEGLSGQLATAIRRL